MRLKLNCKERTPTPIAVATLSTPIDSVKFASIHDVARYLASGSLRPMSMRPIDVRRLAALH